MEEIIKRKTSEDGSKSVTYRKEWEKNGINFSKEVKKVEGGYIICERKFGKPKDDPESEWIDEIKEYVSTENPLEKKEESGDDQMFSFIDTPSLF